MQTARRMVKFAALALAIPLTACQRAPSSPHLGTIARPAFAGEALFRGALAVVRGCVVAKGDRRNSTVLFDPGVTLLPSVEGLHDPHSGNDIFSANALAAEGAFCARMQRDGRFRISSVSMELRSLRPARKTTSCGCET